MIDLSAVAVVLSALARVPDRMAVLEGKVEAMTAELVRIRAALPPLLVPVPQAAQACHVSIPTMRRWIKARLVPVLKIGNTVRVDLSRLIGVDGTGVSGEANAAIRSDRLVVRAVVGGPADFGRHRR